MVGHFVRCRALSRRHGALVCKVVFVSDVTPFLLKTARNPSGKDGVIFNNIITRVEQDRPGAGL